MNKYGLVNEDQLQALLDSVRDPILFADCEHRVRYMNPAAAKHYTEGYGLLGSDLLDCHNEESQQMMVAILGKMRQGLEEELITDNEKQRIYMRAVRDEGGELFGYFERYEDPAPHPV